MTKELSVAEFGELQQCENNMLGGHLQMCEALLRIHGGKLYREQYDSFEEYVDGRWGLKRAQAYRLMNFAETMQAIETSPIGDIKPQNEAQIRPLTRLPLEDRAGAWFEAVGGKEFTPTAAKVEGVVEKIKPKDAKRETRPPPTQDEIDLRGIVQAFEALAEVPYSGQHAAEKFDEKKFGKKFRAGLNWARELHGALLGKDPISIPLKDGTFYHPPTELVDEMQKAFPTVDIEERLRFIQGWNYSNPSKRKYRRGIKRHIFHMLQPKSWDGGNGEDKVDPNTGRHQAL